MRKITILIAGGLLGFFTKTVVEEAKGHLTVNTTTGQAGQMVPPSVFEATAEGEPVKPDADF